MGYIRQGQRLSKEYPLFIIYLFIYFEQKKAFLKISQSLQESTRVGGSF